MLKQDVELAKLLLERSGGIQARTLAVGEELASVEEQLNAVNSVRNERGSYEDILAKAAELLGREDLRVDTPDTSGLEEQASSLRDELERLRAESTQFAALISDLRARAPQILRAAGGEVDPEEDPAPVEEAVSIDAEGLPSIAATRVPTSGNEAARLSHFDIQKVKDLSKDHGLAVIIDCSSAMERVPFYDRHRLALDEAGARDELVLDIVALGGQVGCGFHLIFTATHQPMVAFGPNVQVEDCGGSEDAREILLDRVQELCGQYKSLGIPCAVVTGSPGLADAARQSGAIALQLAEFFMT